MALSSFTEKSVDPEGTQLVPGTGLVRVRSYQDLLPYNTRECPSKHLITSCAIDRKHSDTMLPHSYKP